MVSAQARRDQVALAVSLGASVRRACALLQVSRSNLDYASRMPARDATLAAELTQLSMAHPAYGHRMAWGVVRQTWTVNIKRVNRVWCLLGLQVRKKKSRKLRTGQSRTFAPTGPNQVWAYDFVHDTCANGSP